MVSTKSKRTKTYKADLLLERGIKDLLYNSDRLAEVVEELRDSGNLSILEEIAVNHIGIQQRVNCREKNKDSHYEFRKELNEALIKLGYEGFINMGDDISPDTLLVM